MKNILLVLMSAASITSFAAINTSSSWGDIKTSTKVIANAPTIPFSTGKAGTTYVSVLDVCTSGDKLLTMNKQSTYDINTTDDSQEMVKTGEEVLSTPIKFSTLVASANESDFSFINSERPLEYQIAVTDIGLNTDTQSEGKQLFTRSYKIQPCK